MIKFQPLFKLNLLHIFLLLIYFILIVLCSFFYFSLNLHYNLFVCFICGFSSLYLVIFNILNRSNYFAIAAFSVHAVADFTTGVSCFYQVHYTSFAILVSESRYAFFMFFVLLWAYQLEKRESLSLPHQFNPIVVLKIVLFLASLYFSFSLDIFKMIHHIHDFGWWIVLFAVFYSFFQSAAISILIPLSLKTRNWFHLFVSNGLLIMFSSDIEARYAYIFGNQKASAYSTVWLFGLIVLVFAHVFFSNNKLEKSLNFPRHYLSLRALPTFCIILCLTPILIIISKLWFQGSSTSIFDTIDAIATVTITCFFANILSNILSRRVSEIPKMIQVPQLGENLMYYLECEKIFLPISKKEILLQEFRQFSEKYNKLVKESNGLVQKLIQETKKSSLAKTTQMLAHDVRKPFSMLRMSLDMLKNTEDPEELKTLIKQILPEVNRAMCSVNGMIFDVMEMGTNHPLNLESISPKSLFFQSIQETFLIYYYATIQFHYSFFHHHHVLVEPRKILRVFSNIISNAAQALKMTGDIYFSSKEISFDNKNYIEFSILNPNSVLLEQDIPLLFESFFSKNKQGGTGLGLAIAKKIVLEHGGRIWCQSAKNEQYPNGFVEFLFTLPMDDKYDSFEGSLLPRDSVSLANASEIVKFQNLNAEKRTERDILKSLDSLKRSARVLLVDDERIYCSALNDMLQKSDELRSKILIEVAHTNVEAYELMLSQSFDLVILDIDLGCEENGFDIVQWARSKALKSFLCVHSNRLLATDYKRALEAGADAFLPKPMSRSNLLRLVLQSLSHPILKIDLEI